MLISPHNLHFHWTVKLTFKCKPLCKPEILMGAWCALVPHDSVLCYRNKANVLLGERGLWKQHHLYPAPWPGLNSQEILVSPRGLGKGHYWKTLQSWKAPWLLAVTGCSSWQWQNKREVQGQSKEASGPWDICLNNQEIRQWFSQSFQ